MEREIFSGQQGAVPETIGMKSICLVVALLAFSASALAQDVEDEAHREDRLRTEQLNRRAAAAIMRRDAAVPAGRAAANAGRDTGYDADYAAYRAAQAQYERDLANWRRRAEACRQGYWDACD